MHGRGADEGSSKHHKQNELGHSAFRRRVQNVPVRQVEQLKVSALQIGALRKVIAVMARKQKMTNEATQSAFIFVGKVIGVKAALLEGIDTDKTAVVQVVQIVKAPPAFNAVTGQQVTVRFKSLAGITKSKTMTFFTNGWIYGSRLALDAVSAVPETDKRTMAASVQQSTTAHEDDEVSARLDSAALAVAGTVVKVEPKPVETTHISEHNPDWHEATVDVDEVIKGKKGTKEVSFLFPNSDDVRWHRLPKYSEGQKGIWLLQRGRKQDTHGIAPKLLAALPEDTEPLTTLHPMDYLPIHELGRIKALAKNR